MPDAHQREWADVVIAFAPPSADVARSIREAIAMGPGHADAVDRIARFLNWLDGKTLFELELRCGTPPTESQAPEDLGLESEFLESQGDARRYRIRLRRLVQVEISVGRQVTAIGVFDKDR